MHEKEGGYHPKLDAEVPVADAEPSREVVVEMLNAAFQEGRHASSPELLALLRKIEHPIVVDFNNVLFSNNPQPGLDKGLVLNPNPTAGPMLEKLRTCGQVIVMTTARSWPMIMEHLRSVGYDEDVILMTPDNYYMTAKTLPGPFGKDSSPEQIRDVGKMLAQWLLDSSQMSLPGLPTLDEVRQEYARIASEEDDELAFDRYLAQKFAGAASDKRVAPYFNKGFSVPIIDDNGLATMNNPGMTGYCVQKFETTFNDPGDEITIAKHNEKAMTLDEAADQVVAYYHGLAA